MPIQPEDRRAPERRALLRQSVSGPMIGHEITGIGFRGTAEMMGICCHGTHDNLVEAQGLGRRRALR
jgi:hypothetical protein